MKNLKIVKLIVVLLVALIVMSISTSVSALNLDLDDPTKGDGNSVLDPDIYDEYPEGEEDKKPTTTPPTTTPSTPSTEEKLPQTGDASDYAIFLLIGLFAVVSIYAYRKAKNYNNI